MVNYLIGKDVLYLGRLYVALRTIGMRPGYALSILEPH